jgi:riboflavin kinase/FMN adenylyltransferase
VSAEDFVRDVLVSGLHAVHVVVGANFTFGHRALGTVETLRRLGPSVGLSAETVDLLELDGRAVSSSSIRAALAEGDLTWPTRALGRRYAVDGTVVAGAGRGHGLGYPTANLETEPRLLLPTNGIYAGRASSDDGVHPAAISVGTNPTFGIEPLHVEAYLLDYEGDLRGRPLTVEFWERLRDEERFEAVDDLVRAMDDDVRRTRAILGPADAEA